MHEGELVPADRELLSLQLGANWTVTGDGRLTGPDAPRLVVAAAADGVRVAADASVPERVLAEVRATVARVRPVLLAGAAGGGGPASGGPVEGGPDCVGREGAYGVPEAVVRARRLVEAATGEATLISAPSYLVAPGTRFAPTAEVVTSSEPGRAALRAANPGNWGAGEWDDLLDGALGPWAMAVEAGRVVAICHTPCASELAAEAGVWTRPGHRGRGHAATVTAAWARVMAATSGGKRLFYSTTAANLASQNVARRLGLRQLGWLWKLTDRRGGG
ncbi:GNAT family N-acetyltransferase [Streptomyces sp. NPDC057702]|uniref:GNAT family N-acetyltransferase n=1 Tax=unclassified Streptomyces TaxID=2593676 RepID=UPI0036B9C6E6